MLVDDQSVVTSIPDDISFGYIRVRKIGKDDQFIAKHTELFKAKGIPYGVFMEVDYINQGEDTTPVKQAEELAVKDRGVPVLPPFIKIISSPDRPIVGSDWPIISTLVSDIVYWYKITFGKRPVGISSNKSSLEAMIPYLTENISGCWFNVIAVSSVLPVLKAPYGKFPFWENSLYNQTLPGATRVSTMLWPGTVEELLAWSKNTSLTLPEWEFDTPSPSEEDPTTEDPTVEVDLTALVNAIAVNTAILTKIDATLQEIKQGFMNGWRLL